MSSDYQQYKDEIAADIRATLANAGCQPILFIGSGFTQRYSDGPSWEGLLRKLADACDYIDKDFAYYKQTYDNDLIHIGSIFTDLYQKWAWDEKHAFPAEYFAPDANHPKAIFIKHMAAQLLASVRSSPEGSYGSSANDAEIAALKAVHPHAIITTNFDQLLEPLFPDYEPVIGQQIYRRSFLNVGEIFKIHGCVSSPLSLILNRDDYQNFEQDQKYLSAKLLTYFIEHPVLVVGYRAEDPNIRNILYDVHRMLFRVNSELIPNIFIVEWDSRVTADSYPIREKVLSVQGTNIRIKSITASSFEWVFRAFETAGALEKVNMKLLRSLMARTVSLVRSDIPKKTVEIDFETLERAVQSGDSFAKLLGITSTADPSQVNLNYRYSLTDVAEQLGFSYWSKAHELIVKLKTESGFDMKASDNHYHIHVKVGKKSRNRLYSSAAVDLLRKVLRGEKYRIEEYSALRGSAGAVNENIDDWMTGLSSGLRDTMRTSSLK
jgi:hypothetical protein